jgi:hypothetical protein
LHAWHTHDEYTQGRKFHVSDIQTSLIYELKVSIQFYEDAEHIRRKKPTTIEVIGFYLMNLSVEGPTMWSKKSVPRSLNIYNQTLIYGSVRLDMKIAFVHVHLHRVNRYQL